MSQKYISENLKNNISHFYILIALMTGS